jgi:hypothetical protein
MKSELDASSQGCPKRLKKKIVKNMHSLLKMEKKILPKIDQDDVFLLQEIAISLRQLFHTPSSKHSMSRR